MLIGSANLNDRSMWGSRDSELAVYIEGGQDFPIVIGNKGYVVNEKIWRFRSNIFKEHFGFAFDSSTDVDVAFPSCEYFWARAWNIVYTNTQIYDICFKCYPSDKFNKWADILRNNANSSSQPTQSKNVVQDTSDFDAQAFEKLKDYIQGHAVVYPYKFLDGENLLDAKVNMANIGLSLLPIKALF
jgi:phospholipase D1/2